MPLRWTVCQELASEANHVRFLKGRKSIHSILPTESQLLRDLQVALVSESRLHSASLTFSLDVWVDIRSIMENEVVHAFETAQRTASDVEQMFLSHDPSKLSGEHRSFTKEWQIRINQVKYYVLDDCLFEPTKLILHEIGVLEDPDPFLLLKKEPVWAGLLVFRMRLVRSELGHQYTALTSIVEAAAYPYHSCLAVDKTLAVWKEMTRYIETYTDQSKFKTVLNESRAPASIIRNFERVMTAHEAVVEQWVNPYCTHDTFVPDVSIRRTLYRRYAHEEAGDRAGPDGKELGIHRLGIERGDWEEMMRDIPHTCGTCDCGSKSNGIAERSQALKDSSRKPEPPLLVTDRAFKRKAIKTRLSHLETLQMLDDTVTTQLEGLLTLDYLKLFDESVEFLKAIIEAFSPELRERVGYDDETRLACLGRLPVHLVRNLDEDEGLVVDSLVKICRGFLAGLEGPRRCR